MVLQNKHKAQASRQYKKAHGIPTSSNPERSRETGQERQLRLGSNADRYRESDEEDDQDNAAEPDEVDEELLAHQQAEAQELERFLAAQQSRLTSPTRLGPELDDSDDVDPSFAHLRLAPTGKKGKVFHHAATEETKGLEGEARRAQAVRDLKDRFSVPSPPPPPATTASTNSKPVRAAPGAFATKPRLADVRRPPPLPGMNNHASAGQAARANEQRGGQDFLDSLL